MSAKPETVWFLNNHVTFVRSAEGQADGVFIAEHRLPYGESTPLHVHHDEDEVFHVIEGVVRVRVGETEVVGRAGDTLVGPKGVPHSFRVESPQGARMLGIACGSGFEGFLRAMARPAETDGLPQAAAPTPAAIAALTAAAAAHGISILGPPLSA